MARICLSNFSFYLLLLCLSSSHLALSKPIDDLLNNDVSRDRESHDSAGTNGSASHSPVSSEPITTEMPTEFTSYKNTSTFSCQGRITGYYADVKLGCRVYHFCTQMDNLGEMSYQRMSYVCLEGSSFDQRDLNCVKTEELKVACERAESEYESSNRQFDSKEESQPSFSDNLAASIMMNPITRFIAG